MRQRQHHVLAGPGRPIGHVAVPLQRRKTDEAVLGDRVRADASAGSRHDRRGGTGNADGYDENEIRRVDAESQVSVFVARLCVGVVQN